MDERGGAISTHESLRAVRWAQAKVRKHGRGVGGIHGTGDGAHGLVQLWGADLTCGQGAKCVELEGVRSNAIRCQCAAAAAPPTHDFDELLEGLLAFGQVAHERGSEARVLMYRGDDGVRLENEAQGGVVTSRGRPTGTGSSASGSLRARSACRQERGECS